MNVKGILTVTRTRMELMLFCSRHPLEEIYLGTPVMMNLNVRVILTVTRIVMVGMRLYLNKTSGVVISLILVLFVP